MGQREEAGASDDEFYSDDQLPTAKRQKRHRFKKFAERVAEVDVDVFRNLGPKRADPLPGAASFFQERLTAWRELNAAADWLTAAAELHPLCHSLPQLVHHQEQILDILLQRLHLPAALSLEPILDLVGTLARDLQADFPAHMERVLCALCDLVDEGVDREPELLQHVFACLSAVCKHLCKLLAADPLPTLRLASRLRHHPASHVRALAAQSLGYMLRHAQAPTARATVRFVLAEAVFNPSETNVHSSAALVAAAAAGVGHGLHSRATALLALLLRRDALAPADLASAGEEGGSGELALDEEAIEARVAAVAAACFALLLDHLRRGSGSELWALLQREATARVDAVALSAADGGGADEAGSVRWAAARAVGFLAGMVEYYKGSRVEDYEPLFHLAARLAQSEYCAAPDSGGLSESAEAAAAGGGGSESAEEGPAGGSDPVAAAFLRPSLPVQALRLMEALAAAHHKSVGASRGPVAMQQAAPQWATVFLNAPASDVLRFVRALVAAPGGGEVARCFGPHMLAAVGRRLLDGKDQDVCWPLLMDVCTTLAGPGSVGLPVILTATGVGPQLAAHVRHIASSPLAGGEQVPSEGDLAAAWAAVHCLPHAAESSSQAMACCEGLVAATSRVLSAGQAAAGGAAATPARMLMLHATARGMLAFLAARSSAARLEELVTEALALLELHPTNYHAAYAAAETLQLAKAAGVALPEAQSFRALAALLAPNVAQSAAPLRVETMRVLCSFDQPPMQAAAAAASSGEGGLQPCDALPQLLGLEIRPAGADSGRQGTVSLGRVRNYLEYKRLPDFLVPVVVQALLGVLHIRFAGLWAPAGEALATALDSYPALSWPLVLAQLSAAQAAFLAGDCERRPHAGATGAAPPPALLQRFAAAADAGSAAAAGGSTDAAARLTHLLKAVAKANNSGVAGASKRWVPLFLSFSAAKGLGSEAEPEDAQSAGAAESAEGEEQSEDEDEAVEEGGGGKLEGPTSRVSMRPWRFALREWLALLGGLKGVRGVHRSAELQSAVASHVMDVDPAVQQAALKCLRTFKVEWLAPYVDRLLHLADNKTLREELTAFPLALRPTSVRVGDSMADGILPEHRAELVELLTRLLYPKMRKRSGRLGGKGAPGSARSAILSFLSGAEPAELRTLLRLFLAPLGAAFVPPPGFDAAAPAEEGAAWWGQHLGRQPGAFWLAAIDSAALNAAPLRRRIGYLNTLDDLLKHLGHRMEAFLPELLALAVVLLEGAAAGTAGAAGETAGEGAKEVRIRCLRLVAAVLERFHTAADYNFLWPRLLAAAEPFMERLAAECAADRAPPLVELTAALAASQHLAPVLSDGPSAVSGAGAPPAEVHRSGEAWAAQGALGSRLLASCIAALSSPHCAEPARAVMLGALENMFDLPDPLPEQLLRGHTPSLLVGLQAVVVAVWQRGGHSWGGGKRPRHGQQQQGRRQVALGAPKRATAARALAILEVVGGRATDWETTAQLTDALLPLLQPQSGRGKKRADEELLTRTLAALEPLWSRFGAQSDQHSNSEQRQKAERMATTLSPLAGSLASREARESLCAAFAATAQALPELQPASQLLAALNASSTVEIGEPDYETLMAAYGKLTPLLWGALPALGAPLLLQHCARDLRNADDLGLRHAASQALANFILAAAQAAKNISATEPSSDEISIVAAEGAAEGASGGSGVPRPVTAAAPAPAQLALAQRLLFPQLKRGLTATSLAVRQEHLSLLRALILSLPAHYPDLLPLTDADQETDFLLNVAHLQLHRRARALARLTRLIKAGSPPLTLGALMGVVLPLLQQAIAEGRANEGAGHESKQVDVDRGANVADAAVGALAAAVATLPWVQYHQVLGQYLRLMARHADGPASKPVLRAVCAILDSFHFLAPAPAAESAAAAALVEAPNQSSDAEADGEEESYEGGGVTGAAAAAPPPRAEVLRLLSSRVVPELRAQMVSGETVRAPVALALVKVLKLLPIELMRQELPRTLQLVANLLRLRLQRWRDDARAVLVSMAAELGPDYLPFTIEVLRSALPAKGYTAHILGYTVHAVLHAVAPVAAAQGGCLDDSLQLVLPVVEADLFGDIADAKDVDAFAAGYKEAKRCRANDTFLLLASLVTFSTHLPPLLAPVRDRLAAASAPRLRNKLVALLQAASRGVITNPSVTPRDLCEFVFAVADAGLAAEEATRAKAKSAAEAAVSAAAAGGAAEAADPAALHQHLLVEFALSTFQSALKKGVVVPRAPQNAPLLDPLLPLLVRALRSRHAPTVTAALQALSLLMPAELPGMETAAAGAGKALTDLLKRCPKTTHPIAQDSFKLLAAMLRQCTTYSPPTPHLRFLLSWAFTDLEESAERQTAFTLLRAILARRLALPEVYDLMGRVQELVVRCQSGQVRQLAAATLLQFLLDFPMGERRLRQHLHFLLTNLAYEHESGREAALGMLGTVVDKFPEEVVTEWAETIFLPLVTRLFNDASPKCRTAAGAVLSTLLRRTAPDSRDRLVAFCLQWLKGSDARLVRAAAQTLGILAEVEAAAFGRRATELLPPLSEVLLARAELDDDDAAALEAEDADGDGGGRSRRSLEEAGAPGLAAPGWQEAYYGLGLLQKVLTVAPARVAWAAGDAPRACWAAAQRLLLHRHSWVRQSSGRLVGAGLADSAVWPALLEAGGPTAAGALALSFFRQLDSPAADAPLAGQAVKCLVHLSLPMYEKDAAAGRLPKPPKLPAPAAAAAADGGKASAGSMDAGAEAGNGDAGAAGVQRPSGGRVAVEAAAEEAVEDEDGDEQEDVAAAEEAAAGSLTLHGLVRRMVRLADNKTFARQLQRSTALRFVAALASRLGPLRVAPYLPVMLRPLYRITEPGASGNSEEVQTLADEILAHLRTLAGAEALLAAYNAAREAVRRQRTERKRRAAVQTLVDPEAAARRKLRTAERKASGKRKQLEQVRRLRSAGVVVKNKRARRERE